MSRPGETLQKDSNEKLLVQFDWTDWLHELDDTAEIASSTWAITGGNGDGALTKDNETVVTGDLKTQARIMAGTAGQAPYKVTNTIVTNESPAQTGVRFVFVRVF